LNDASENSDISCTTRFVEMIRKFPTQMMMKMKKLN